MGTYIYVVFVYSVTFIRSYIGHWSIKTESAHVGLYINTCRHRHSLFSSYNTQEGELLRACCSENCLFGQMETNATGISSGQV